MADTVIDALMKDRCCGCASCRYGCPTDAIEMKPDDAGFYYPSIDASSCIRCGRCVKVCPVLNPATLPPEGKSLDVRVGYAKDQDLLKKCASGGAATLLSEAFLKKGGVVVGTSYSDDFRYIRKEIGRTSEDLLRFRSSKYVQSRPNDIFPRVKELLREGTPVLFIGLPCEVAALRSFIEREEEKLFTVDLICQGPTSERVLSQYVEYLERKNGSRIVSLNTRYKKTGWRPAFIKAEFENGRVFDAPLNSTPFGLAFNTMNRVSCSDCAFKGDHRASDLTIGDAWHITSGEAFDPQGVSVLIPNTSKGAQLVEQTEGMKLWDSTFDETVTRNPYLVRPKGKREARDAYEKKFVASGVVKAASMSRDFKGRIKAYLECRLGRKL